MEERRERLRRWRMVVIFAVFIAGLGLLLTQCPRAAVRWHWTCGYNAARRPS
jgi:hypothetical protein